MTSLLLTYIFKKGCHKTLCSQVNDGQPQSECYIPRTVLLALVILNGGIFYCSMLTGTQVTIFPKWEKGTKIVRHRPQLRFSRGKRFHGFGYHTKALPLLKHALTKPSDRFICVSF